MKERRFYTAFNSYLTKKEFYNLAHKFPSLPKNYQKHLNFTDFLIKNFTKRFSQILKERVYIKPYLNCCTIKLLDSLDNLSSLNNFRRKLKFFGSYKEAFEEMGRIITTIEDFMHKKEFLYVAPFGGKIILIFKPLQLTLCFFCRLSVHVISYSKFMEKEYGLLVTENLHRMFHQSLLPKIKKLPTTHPLQKIIKRLDFPIIL